MGDLQVEAKYLRSMVGKLQHYTNINIGTHKRLRSTPQLNKSKNNNNRRQHMATLTTPMMHIAQAWTI